MKALSLIFIDKNVFWKLHFKEQIMQPTEMVWTTLVGDHIGTISVECGKQSNEQF